MPAGSRASTVASSQAEAAGLDHEQHHVDVGQRAGDGAVERAVQRGGVAGLEAGRVDEDELRVADACACR